MSSPESKDSQESKRSQLSVDSGEAILKKEVIRECRICNQKFDEEKIRTGKVINPCNCQGMFAFTHKDCINRRLERNGHNKCDICRFNFKMKTRPKSLWNWICTKPNLEELVELLIRSLNLLTLWLISEIVINYSEFPLNRISTWSLRGFAIIRAVILLNLWRQLVLQLIENFKLWKKKNRRVFVEQNPNYKSKAGFQISRSPSRVSGFITKSRNSSPKKED